MWNVKLHLDQLSGRLTSVRTQRARPLILDTLQKMRTAAPMADRPGLGRWALSVPEEDHLALCLKYPDLASVDAGIRSAAWGRFIASSESLPYRVRERI
jgi:hypothetical protein